MIFYFKMSVNAEKPIRVNADTIEEADQILKSKFANTYVIPVVNEEVDDVDLYLNEVTDDKDWPIDNVLSDEAYEYDWAKSLDFLPVKEPVTAKAK